MEAAAQNYFGKTISQVTVEESASLSCVLKNPGGLNPRLHPVEHKRWRDHVMDRMVEEHFLTAADAEEYKARPVVLAQRTPDARLSYVYDEIRQQAMKIIGEEEAQVGGFNIYTSIDSHLQKVAEESLRARLTAVENLPEYPHPTYARYKASMEAFRKKLAAKEIDPETPRPQADYLQGAILAIDNRDGSILALVGGVISWTACTTGRSSPDVPPALPSYPLCMPPRFKNQNTIRPLRLKMGRSTVAGS